MLKYSSLLLLVAMVSCRLEDDIDLSEEELMHIPKGFMEISFPEGNEFTIDRWKLGKKLFYDPGLSADGKVSCGSCHLSENAFAHNTPLSQGNNGAFTNSNTPSLVNVAYNQFFTRAGGVNTLEKQVLIPIEEHNEFNNNILAIVQWLKSDSVYAYMSLKAYDREMDAYVLTRAIANFERSLISGNSPYDQYVSQGKMSLSTAQERGLILFNSTKSNCSSCHSSFNFTNNLFENNGLYINYADSGRIRVTGLASDRARFKVPSLRNVALTAPYMHDGSLNTLEEVVEHYNSGGKAHENKSKLIQPLALTQRQKADLVAFLHALTDTHFINDKRFKP